MSSFLLTDVRIFDGQDTIESGAVLVESGKIKQVSSSRILWDGTTISKPGHTVIPGLIDCMYTAIPEIHSPCLRACGLA
jgi:imidazolonepropionase-like amidohydrolase